MAASIDQLPTAKHLIDLEAQTEGDFDITDRFVLRDVTDDVLLAEYIDLTNDGENVTRGGIVIPLNTLSKAWRKAKVLIAGPKTNQVKLGDIIIFPNDKGLPVSKMPIVVDGKKHVINKGLFLNEDRIFGICDKVDSE